MSNMFNLGRKTKWTVFCTPKVSCFMVQPPGCSGPIMGHSWSVLPTLDQCLHSHQFSSVSQSCPTLCDPMDCSAPGASVYGVFQARILEWGAIAFSEFLNYPNSSRTWSLSLFLCIHFFIQLLWNSFWFVCSKKKKNYIWWYSWACALTHTHTHLVKVLPTQCTLMFSFLFSNSLSILFTSTKFIAVHTYESQLVVDKTFFEVGFTQCHSFRCHFCADNT